MLNDDATAKVKNIFHIDVADKMQALRLPLLRLAFAKLRISFNDSFPLECEPRPSLNGASVGLMRSNWNHAFPLEPFQVSGPGANNTTDTRAFTCPYCK